MKMGKIARQKTIPAVCAEIVFKAAEPVYGPEDIVYIWDQQFSCVSENHFPAGFFKEFYRQILFKLPDLKSDRRLGIIQLFRCICEASGFRNSPECNEIIREGREFQQEQGFTQWTEDYPNIDVIRSDVREGKGYAVKADGKIAGYLCVDFGGEPAYENIRGEWRTEEPYAVVHRLAFSKEFRGIGLSKTTFDLIDELCLSKGVKGIRGDTDPCNERMQHVLEKNGFQKCGYVIFQDSDKAAYDKIIR